MTNVLGFTKFAELSFKKELKKLMENTINERGPLEKIIYLKCAEKKLSEKFSF